jgi:hypothetical protein
MRGSLIAGVYVAGSLIFVAGCGQDDAGYKAVDTSSNKTADTLQPHDHAHGSHGGHLVALGNKEYHAEVTYVPILRKVGVYILGPDQKTAHPIDAKSVKVDLVLKGKPMAVTLDSKPLDTEKDGKSSHFEGTGGADLYKDAKSIEDLEGKLTVEIDGKSYTGELGHDHDHDGHDHGKDGHDHKDEGKDHDHAADDHKDHDHKEGEHKDEAQKATK